MPRFVPISLTLLALWAAPAVAAVGTADLQVTQTDSPDPVPVGGIITYTVNVKNAGPDPAGLVSLGDTLPAGTTYIGASLVGGACSMVSASQVTCSLTTLANGSSAVMTLMVRAMMPGIVTNTAHASSAAADPNMADNMSSELTSVMGGDGGVASLAADLSLVKTAAPEPVARGGRLTYTLTVHNAGPQTATGITLDDFLPAGVTFVGASGPGGIGCSYDSAQNHVACPIPDTASGGSAAATIQVDAVQAGSITNTASVQGQQPDPNIANNQSSATSTVTFSADLSVTLADSPDPVTRGGTLTYTITATNNGPGAGVAIDLTDSLPAGLTYQSNSQGGSCSFNAPTLHCTGVKLDPGASFTVNLVATVNTDNALDDSVTVSGNAADPSPGNNTASAHTTVTPLADLGVTKTAPATGTVGGNLTYTITASNAGPSTATNVHIVDSLPIGVSLQSATTTTGSCATVTSTRVQCSFGTLASGQSASAILVVQPTSAGTISNIATVSGNETDPAMGNNMSTATTTVSPAASGDLALSKTDDADPALLGAPLTYTIVVSNSPAAATGVTVMDPLPTSVTLVSSRSTLGTCNSVGGSVTCSLGAMAPSDTATITIIVTPNAVGPISNTATVTAAGTDPNPANNSATATTQVIAQPVDAGIFDAAPADAAGSAIDAAGAGDAARTKPKLESGCGCRTGGDGAGAGGALLAIAALVLWRRRRRT